MKKKSILNYTFWISLIILVIALALIPTANKGDKTKSYTFKAKITEVDNSNLITYGTFPRGSQKVKFTALSGEFKGGAGVAISNLNANPEFDTLVKAGDKVIIAIKDQSKGLEGSSGIVVEHHRTTGLAIIAALFVLLLVLFAGRTGLKAVFSFFATMLVITKFLVPLLLKGINPTLLITATVIILSMIIIFSIAGFTKKGLSAVLGTVTGLILTAGVTFLAGALININGYTMSHTGYLISIGYFDLDMTQILYGAVILGASGAAMDVAMDIAASMEEIHTKRPDISRKEITRSGFNIGRAVIGTMTTTLVLAYSGSYITLLMIFSDRDTGLFQAMNMKIVSVEIMRTIVGSIGLVLVAPTTAIIAGFILCSKRKVKDN
ncbi:MAG: YibE/F family protein [Spirochaetales bacterium]|nr:YibE/F family protein [Spirochaetales bacterium]